MTTERTGAGETGRIGPAAGATGPAPRPRRRFAPDRSDIAAAAVTALAVLTVTALLGGRNSQIGTAPLALGLATLLLARRSRPVTVLLLSVQLVIVYRAAGLTEIGWIWPASAAYFTVAADERPGRSTLVWAGGTGLIVAGFAANWESAVAGRDPHDILTGLGAEVLWLALVLAVATAYRNWLRWRTELSAGLARTAYERELEARRRTADERLQIARELHDVVAHTLTVVGVQLRVAVEAIEDSPAEARAALDIAQQVRTIAVTDLRSLVGVLRDPGDAAGRPGLHLVPESGLEGIEGLLARAGSSGLDIGLDTSGDPAGVPAPVALAVYRIVQESLTNTVRHAGAVRATVRLRYTAEHVSVEVIDDGTATGPHGTAGHGISGMRERVAALDGTFTAGPAEGGGYSVRATIPVPDLRS